MTRSAFGPVGMVASDASASSVCVAFGGALGVALLGTVFFDGIGHGVSHAVRVTLVAELGLLLVTLLGAFLLPRRAREGH
ncbi:hypothetical protein [Micromonospora sp. NPDC005806]|uniref:hypothetical protein n=1 Tax=Micromonospora sp. NPDC005806 TaxID=3364234 RepID=UPI0036C8B0B2